MRPRINLEIVKNMDKQKWIVLILLGILFLIIALPVDSKNSRNLEQNSFGKKSESSESVYETQMEKRLTELLEQMEGVGKVDVMITLEENEDTSMLSHSDATPKVRGVLVVVQGADNDLTRVKIYEAIQALFSIDAHRISIVEMGAQEGT